MHLFENMHGWCRNRLLIIALLPTITTSCLVATKSTKDSNPHLQDNASNNLGGCSAQFGVYFSDLDGNGISCVVSDENRELNHARFSPDGKSVIYTRYNKFSDNGFAQEKFGYQNTEPMIAGVLSSDPKVVLPAVANEVNANAYWTPDGKKILIFHSDQPSTPFQIVEIDIGTGDRQVVGLPDKKWAADPHQIGTEIVFVRLDSTDNISKVFVFDRNSNQLKQLTNYNTSGDSSNFAFPFGDYDPKLSPDGKQVAFMRHMNDGKWQVFVLDRTSLIETNISQGQVFEAMPEWSPDGTQLVFWTDTGLYRFFKSNDSFDREKIPLPTGYFYSMPAFATLPSGKLGVVFSACKLSGGSDFSPCFP